jgi:NAD(P)-dependent dehydrogenase (short-subunit alcohol dehydrogenase family)
MPQPPSGPVLVTGASTGIGRAIAEHLAAKNHPVIAGARKDADLDALGKISNVTPIRLDVTRAGDVTQVAGWIRDSGRGLFGLVNNAGIGTMGPLVEMSIDELYRSSRVNVDGMHRMVGAMFPFLRESHGRIVNISSIAGFLVEPFFGSYNMSKHAVEAYTDLLREEIAPFGVRVSSIEPGNFQSNIYANGVALMGDPARVKAQWEHSLYRDQLLQAFDSIANDPEVLYRTGHPKPTRVAEAVAHALESPEPRPRYAVCSKKEADAVFDRMLTILREVNDSQPRPLTTAELVARVEKSMA